MPSEMNTKVLLQEVVETPRRAYFPFPGLQVIERPGWMQLICPAFTRGGFNEVSLAVLRPEEADAVIAETVAQYRAADLRFRWAVGPDSAPADLPERLERHGLARTWVRGMARTLGDWSPTAVKGVTVEEALELAAAERFTRIMAEGWNVAPSPLLRVHHLLFQQADRRQRLFIAWRGDEPAGVASYIAFPRSAYLLGGVVLPKHRGHGVYRALVNARIQDALHRGLTVATSQAMEESSAPILERLGFETVVRFPVFRG